MNEKNPTENDREDAQQEIAPFAPVEVVTDNNDDESGFFSDQKQH